MEWFILEPSIASLKGALRSGGCGCDMAVWTVHHPHAGDTKRERGVPWEVNVDLDTLTRTHTENARVETTSYSERWMVCREATALYT